MTVNIFKNIGNISERNFEHHKASIWLMIEQGQYNEAKIMYELLFTPDELENIRKNEPLFYK